MSGVAPSETGMTPAGRTIFLHMGHVRSRSSQVLMQWSQKKWLHVSFMGVLMGSCANSHVCFSASRSFPGMLLEELHNNSLQASMQSMCKPKAMHHRNESITVLMIAC